MAPDERVSSGRPAWGSLDFGSAVDECLRERSTASPSHVEGVDVARHLFGAKVINDGAGMIRLDVPHLVTQETEFSASVQVNWPLILAKAVARLYLIADGNREPLLASIALIPDMVPPHVCVNVRLDESTDVRAVVECGDGTLLQVRRWVSVMPRDLNAPGIGKRNP